ncbi:MAG: cupin domain-containing protein, partial [Ruminiclostridium sp.]|nr:cupin domain-containing protein [Ruminiclostridium sp.]
VYSEWEVHEGDEVVVVLKGSLSIRIPMSGENSEDAVYRSYKVDKGEKFYIPEGTSHQYINFCNDTVEAYIAVAPNL